MSTVHEVIVSTDASGKLWNCCVSDAITGTTVHSFKRGNTAHKTLAFVGNDYLIGAMINEPILNIWSMGKNSKKDEKFVLPGIVSALAVSNNGWYCACAINVKIYVWELMTGDLLSVVERHMQPITCLKFTSDDTFLISSGADGFVKVWDVYPLISESITLPSNVGVRKPRYNWIHSAEVMDFHIGFIGPRARVSTVATDGECRVYDLVDGKKLVHLLLNACLISVTMDASEQYMFMGSLCGFIFQVNAFSSLQLNNKDNSDSPIFIGHSGAVRCLSISLDGKTLLSGSDDSTIKLWNIESKLCMKTIKHRSPVTNAFFRTCPYTLLTEKETEPDLIISSFKRCMSNLTENEDISENVVEIRLRNRKLSTLQYDQYDEDLSKVSSIMQSGVIAKSKEELEKELRLVSDINARLYSYSLNSLMTTIKDPADNN